MPRLRHHEPSSSSDSACVASSASRRSSLVHDGGRLSFPLNRVAPELRCLRIQFWIDERLTPNSSAKSSCVLSPTRARSTTFALSSSEYCILTSSAPLNLRATRGDIYPDTGGDVARSRKPKRHIPSVSCVEHRRRSPCQRRYGSIHPKTVLEPNCKSVTERNPITTRSFYTKFDNMVSQTIDMFR